MSHTLRLLSPFRALVFLLSGGMLAYSLFFRTLGDDQVSGAFIVIGLSFLGLLLTMFLVIIRGSFPYSQPLMCSLSFFLISTISIIASVIFLKTDIGLALNFFIEIIICFGMFLCFYLFSRFDLQGPSSVAFILCFLALYLGWLTLFKSFDTIESLRRLDGFSARNLFGNAIALSCISVVFLIVGVCGRTSFLGVLLLPVGLICALLLFLIGSRQALFLGVVLSILLLFQALGVRRFLLLSVIFLAGFFVLFFWINQQIDLDRLLLRFDSSRVADDGFERFEVYSRAIREIDTGAFLFGRPELYEVWNEHVTHPHNIFISILRHLGVFSLFCFVLSLFLTARRIQYALHLFKSSRMELFYLTALFVCAFVYVMVSGNMTRSFHVFLLWGFVLGFADKLMLGSIRKMLIGDNSLPYSVR